MPSDEKAQPTIEDDRGNIAVLWERDGKTYALTTRDDGSIVFTVSPYNKAVPPVRTTIQEMRAALAATEAGEQPVAWRWRCTEGSEPNQRWRLCDVLPSLDGMGRVEVQPLFAAPPSEASRDERAAQALDLIAKMAGNVVFNGKQRPISHEDHMRAWADIEATAMSRVDNPPKGK